MKLKYLLLIIGLFCLAYHLDTQNGYFEFNKKETNKITKVANPSKAKTIQKQIIRPDSDSIPVYQPQLTPITNSKPLPRVSRNKALPAHFGPSEMYIHINGKKVPYKKYQEQQELKRIEELQEKRYREYVKECLLENLDENFISIPYEYQIWTRINHKGDIEGYSIFSVIKGGNHYPQNNSQQNKYKKTLEQAFLKSGPFQPFPDNLHKKSITYIIEIGRGKTNTTSHNGNIEKFSKRFNNFGRQRNPKKVEDVKLCKAYISASGYTQENRLSYSTQILRDKHINWTPYKTSANKVVFEYTLGPNGEILNPVFIEKSEIKEANESAMDAIYSTKISQINERLKSFPLIKIKGTFIVE